MIRSTYKILNKYLTNPLFTSPVLRKQAYYFSVTTTHQTQLTEQEQIKIFQSDSTYQLIKKLMIYKLMSSNLFINYALLGMNYSYRILGRKLTNFLINKTAGEIFTSGETFDSLTKDIAMLESRGIKSVGNYVVEGIHEMDYSKIEEVFRDLMESITILTDGKTEGHLAIKLTSLISIDIMTRLSKAQQIFLEDILELWKKDIITKEEIKQNFQKQGITVSEEVLNELLSLLRFDDNNTDSLSRVERYANGHLFHLFPEKRNPILLNIGSQLGVTEEDFTHFDQFAKKVVSMTTYSHQRNCLLYVDAEQTYMQRAIDSFAMQLTHKFNVDDKTIIMNGFQNYLKIMERKIPLELESSKKLGYNLGIKMVRGAYMNEERQIAQEQGYESPICNDIESTHRTYNTNLRLILENLGPKDRLFIGSHNNETVEIAKKVCNERKITSDGRVTFGQLKGFSDQITGVLANEGFPVYKYLPYGPTEKVMPYLVRRGQESKQVLREQKFQNEFLRKEIKRRLKLGK